MHFFGRRLHGAFQEAANLAVGLPGAPPRKQLGAEMAVILLSPTEPPGRVSTARNHGCGVLGGLSINGKWYNCDSVACHVSVETCGGADYRGRQLTLLPVPE